MSQFEMNYFAWWVLSCEENEIIFYLIKLVSIIFMLLLSLGMCYKARVCVSFVTVMI